MDHRIVSQAIVVAVRMAADGRREVLGFDIENIEQQFAEVTAVLSKPHPKVAEMFHGARLGLLAFAGFPHQHWRPN